MEGVVLLDVLGMGDHPCQDVYLLAGADREAEPSLFTVSGLGDDPQGLFSLSQWQQQGRPNMAWDGTTRSLQH